jgi:Lon protease-like protein
VNQTETNIALFPLSLLLLPGERTALHIFEPRYQQLIKDVEEGNRFFGIPFFNKTQKPNDIVLGSLVRVVDVAKRYAGGESDIIVEAVDLFELKTYHSKSADRLYPSGTIRLLERYKSWPLNPTVKQHFNELLKQIGTGFNADEFQSNTFQVLRHLNMAHEDRDQFLKIRERDLQEKRLVGLLKFSALIMQQEKQKEFDFYLN